MLKLIVLLFFVSCGAEEKIKVVSEPLPVKKYVKVKDCVPVEGLNTYYHKNQFICVLLAEYLEQR